MNWWLVPEDKDKMKEKNIKPFICQDLTVFYLFTSVSFTVGEEFVQVRNFIANNILLDNFCDLLDRRYSRRQLRYS